MSRETHTQRQYGAQFTALPDATSICSRFDMNIKSAWALRRHVFRCIKLSAMAAWWQLRDDTSWLQLYGKFLETYAEFTKAQDRAMPEGYVYTVARSDLQKIRAIAQAAERFRNTLARDMEEAAPKRYRFSVRCACFIYLTHGLTFMLNEIEQS